MSKAFDTVSKSDLTNNKSLLFIGNQSSTLFDCVGLFGNYKSGCVYEWELCQNLFTITGCERGLRG